jgi:hypothetical protein
VYKYTRVFNFPTVITDVSGNKSVHPKYYFAGDFTGDGRMKILAVSCHQPFGIINRSTQCYLFDLESNTILYEGSPFAFNVSFVGTNQLNPEVVAQNSDRLYILDCDGDGKSDICLINSSGTYIYTFNSLGTSYSMLQIGSGYTNLKRADLANRELMLGEFNGDGKPDFLLSPKAGNSDWYVYYSMGNGQFDKVSATI